MYQQRIKLLKVSLLVLVLAYITSIIALFKHILFLILCTNFCIAIALICEGLIAQYTFQKQSGFRLILLGVLLLIITGALFIHYLKSK